MVFAFGIGTGDSLGDNLGVLITAYGFAYLLLFAAALVVTSILYIVLRLLPSKMTNKLVFNPEKFIVIQSMVFPLYFIGVVVATQPILNRDYEYKYYAMMYSILILTFMIIYQLLAKRAQKNIRQ